MVSTDTKRAFAEALVTNELLTELLRQSDEDQVAIIIASTPEDTATREAAYWLLKSTDRLRELILEAVEEARNEFTG